VELSIPSLHQLAEETPALAGLLLRNESRPDSLPPYDAAVVEEAIHQEAVEAVEEAVEEAEEHRLLRSPRLRLKQLSHKQLTSEPWEPPLEYSKEIEPMQMISLTNFGTIIASTEELPDLTLL
jgi:L-lactate utilization protein LutC